MNDLKFDDVIPVFDDSHREMPFIITSVPEAEPIRLYDYYSDKVEYYKSCEMQTKRWMVRNIKPDWNIIDAGANIGCHSILMARLAHQGQVLAIEATENTQKLQTNIIRNKISNIEILQAPLGDEVKYKKDKIHHNWGEEPIQLEAKYETLDSIYDQLGRPKIDLIKIDVDGYDLEVIKGGLRLLREQRPVIIIEINHALLTRGVYPTEVLNFCANHGYAKAKVLDLENYVLEPTDGAACQDTEPTMSLSFDNEPMYLTDQRIETDWSVMAIEQIKSLENGSFDSEKNIIFVNGIDGGLASLIKLKPTQYKRGCIRFGLSVHDGSVGISLLSTDLTQTIGKRHIASECLLGSFEITVDDMSAIGGLLITSANQDNSTASLNLHSIEVRSTVDFQITSHGVWNDPNLKRVPLLKLAEELKISTSHLSAADELQVANVHRLNDHLPLRKNIYFPELFNTDIGHMKMENNDAFILSQIYRAANIQRHLEIGTWMGFGASVVVKNSAAEVVTINLENGEMINGKPAYKLSDGTPSDTREHVGKIYKDGGYSDRITQIFGDSKILDFAKFSDPLFDSVLIDGGHDSETVINDTNKVINSVKPGGMVIWHDFVPDPSVLKQHSAAHGVVSGILRNWEVLKANFDKLFWIRPSWILIGIKSNQTKLDFE